MRLRTERRDPAHRGVVSGSAWIRAVMAYRITALYLMASVVVLAIIAVS